MRNRGAGAHLFRMQDADVRAGTLEDRLTHVLEELRVVLPGTQALLGFQLVAVFSTGFEVLPQWQKDVHFVSLLFVTFGAMLLMTPAAYHRIVDDGDDTEAMHMFATRALMLAMAALGIGLSLDLVVVAEVVLGSLVIAIATASIALVTFATAWFVLPLALRAREKAAARAPQHTNLGKTASRT
jgi:hypothetical protein